jgi:hypothetical protein
MTHHNMIAMVTPFFIPKSSSLLLRTDSEADPNADTGRMHQEVPVMGHQNVGTPDIKRGKETP